MPTRSKKDILDTERMLERLTRLLTEHAIEKHPSALVANKAREHAERLRRISMTLRAWHELECNEDIVRGRKGPAGGFVHAENGTTFLYTPRIGSQGGFYSPIADRERGALTRLKAIMARYPALQAYVQTDPRGCALYILKPGDVPEGANASAYYSRGLAVFK